jgi:hypothetical protein
MADQWFTLVSVLSGTIVGGLLNSFVASRAKQQEWKLGLLRERILERQRLYADFLASSQRLIVQAMDAKLSNAAEMSVIHNELARVELVASREVIDSATKICSHILDSHAQNPPKDRANFYDLKTKFVCTVREELASLERPSKSSKRAS